MNISNPSAMVDFIIFIKTGERRVIVKNKKKKEWSSVIELRICDSGMECETKEEYIERLKESFQDEYCISLTDDEITNIQSQEISNE